MANQGRLSEERIKEYYNFQTGTGQFEWDINGLLDAQLEALNKDMKLIGAKETDKAHEKTLDSYGFTWGDVISGEYTVSEMEQFILSYGECHAQAQLSADRLVQDEKVPELLQWLLDYAVHGSNESLENVLIDLRIHSKYGHILKALQEKGN